MSESESFASNVSARIRQKLHVSSDDAQPMTGIEVLAILSAIIAACDQFNPGWREQVTSFFGRLLPPWGSEAREAKRIRVQGEKIRARAVAAFDPDSQGPFARSAARRDRSILINATRARVQALRDGSGYPIPPENATVDAILDETLTSGDRRIDMVLSELASG